MTFGLQEQSGKSTTRITCGTEARLYLNVLDAAIVGDDGVLEVLVPEVELREVTQQVLVHHLELAGQHSANKEIFYK
jgi:hypothetical protein